MKWILLAPVIWRKFTVDMSSSLAFPWWMCSITKLTEKTHKKSPQIGWGPHFQFSQCFMMLLLLLFMGSRGTWTMYVEDASGRLTWQWRNNRLKFKDVSPIKHGNFPASHVSFRVCTGGNVFFPHEERPLMSDWTSDSRLPTINHPNPSTVGSMIFLLPIRLWYGLVPQL